MRYEHSREDQYLMHYGVPGMQWGVITKEYKPVAFDKRHNRKKKQPTQQELYLQARARKSGRDVGDNLFWQARHNKEQRVKAAQAKANPKQPDIVDKTVKKGFDHFGLGAYSEMASNFLKDQAQNSALNYVKGLAGKGPTYVKGSKALTKILAKPAGAAAKASYALANKISVKNALKGGGKLIKGLAKGTWKSGKAIKRGIQWLENGGYSRIRSHVVKLRNGAHFISKYAKTAVSFLSKTGSSGAKLGREGIRSGANMVMNGARSLLNILRKRR